MTQNPTHSFNLPGTYSVKLIVYNDGCGDSITKANYIIVTPPLAKFVATYNCSNSTQYSFHDSSIGASSWLWDFGDGGTATGQFPATHNYASSGIYTVTLTVSSTTTGCTNSTSRTITVAQAPNFVYTPQNACKGVVTSVSASTFSPAVNAWYWDFGDGSPVIGPNSPSWAHSYVNAGNYIIKLKVVDTLGCADSTSQNITVNGPKANFGTPTTQACNSLIAVFTDSSTLNGGSSPIVKWIWDYGDGGTATGQNPGPHTYTKQGSFPVKLTVTDAAGCSDSLTKGNYIQLSVLNVSFTSQDSFYCPTSLIKFTNTSDPLGGFNPVYTWDYGDSTKSTGFSPPLHNYPAVGLYTVKLQAIDQYGCTGSYTKTNFIRVDTPNANFNIDKAFASCPPLNVTYTFAGHYAKTFLYNFGSGQGVSPDSNTQHLYGFPGTYQAMLTVTSPGGCIATSTKTIQVNGPIINFTYAPVGGCDTLTVNFDAIGTGIIRYVWYFTDGTPADTTTIPTISHTYYNPNKYEPIVAVTDSTNCTVFYPAPIPIIVESVKANFTMDKNRLCENGIVNFNNTSDTTAGTVISIYSWDFGDGQTSTGANIPTVSHMFNGPGLYHVKLTVNTQFGCSDVVTKDVYVVANPTIDIAGDSSQCVPATLNFSGVILVADTSAYTWQWDFGNGNKSTLQVPPSQVYPKAGQYLISLVATNSSGCTDTATSDLFIYPLPTVFAGNDTTICLGQSLPIQVVGAATYNWLPPSNGSLSCTNCANPVASPIVTTTYYVQGTSFQGCVSTDTLVVTVNQPVTVTVSPDDSVCLGQSAQLTASGAANYVWSPAAGLSSIKVANPMASPSTTTTYQVIGSDNKYCFFDTGYVNVRVFAYPVVNAGPDATIIVGSSYQMMGSGSPDVVSIAWTPITALTCTNCYTPTANPNNTTNYTLRLVNDGGCASVDSMRLTVVCNDANFFIPNTFSPNGDGVNDIFYVRGKGLNIISSITIFNRWGQIVFQRKDFAANDPSVGWDGNFNGQKAAADVYIYTVEIICNNSSLIPYHGNVTLVR
jgi:gliding motility-associated-like protein